MARPLRLEFAGALYHVTSRGNRREAIYETDEDRESFLAVLDDVCGTFNWVCHAYCLMGNHYHLLIETPEGNLSRGMRQLNGVYTQGFNQRHCRVGHVFQGRYKAILVEKDSYLLELARYIVLNPVRAQMVRTAAEWPWSSYQATVSKHSPFPHLYTDWLLAAFGSNRSSAVKAYEQFVAAGKNQPSPWQDLKNQVYLGSGRFVSEVQERIDAPELLSEIPASQRRAVPKPIEHYISKAPNRDSAIVAAYSCGGYTLKEVGQHFGLSYSRVSRIVKRVKGKA